MPFNALINMMLYPCLQSFSPSIKLDGFLIDVQEEALLLAWNNNIDTELLEEDLVKAGTISVVDPVTRLHRRRRPARKKVALTQKTARRVAPADNC